ncbi:hypothetical protein EG68_12554 [Paragonimus skrjabini miyazakii]|uniref:Uncharacterized protein n=1 Tax=Paragonimus skrjabini miyazakii TaxID=59628 RepID=A0A8S9YHD7_9TREM|nr:hypothetical protein EG68_12554 [Paragonimus skrjabini miyazakii]
MYFWSASQSYILFTYWMSVLIYSAHNSELFVLLF